MPAVWEELVAGAGDAHGHAWETSGCFGVAAPPMAQLRRSSIRKAREVIPRKGDPDADIPNSGRAGRPGDSIVHPSPYGPRMPIEIRADVAATGAQDERGRHEAMPTTELSDQAVSPPPPPRSLSRGRSSPCWAGAAPGTRWDERGRGHSSEPAKPASASRTRCQSSLLFVRRTRHSRRARATVSDRCSRRTIRPRRVQSVSGTTGPTGPTGPAEATAPAAPTTAPTGQVDDGDCRRAGRGAAPAGGQLRRRPRRVSARTDAPVRRTPRSQGATGSSRPPLPKRAAISRTHVARPSVKRPARRSRAQAQGSQGAQGSGSRSRGAAAAGAAVWLNRAAPDPTPPAARLS